MDEGKYAAGLWHVKEGMADDFVDRWTGWIAWTSENIPGLRSAKLLRSEGDPCSSSPSRSGTTTPR